jgi:hypothetical protein
VARWSSVELVETTVPCSSVELVETTDRSRRPVVEDVVPGGSVSSPVSVPVADAGRAGVSRPLAVGRPLGFRRCPSTTDASPPSW